MVCSSAALRAQGQQSCGEEERHGGKPDLLWLAELTGAHIGLPPLCQDPEDRCSIWENLVSLVDFQCPGFPLTAEELCDYIDIRRTPVASSAACTSTSTVSAHRAGAEPPQPPGDIDYKSNAHLKPPYSYATLICMAMQASKKPKVTLAAICKWISDNFAYFRPADPAWQTAIRHNLCINKRFIKVPRQKGEPGRGAFWKLHPRYAERLKSSTRRERRTLGEHTQPSSSKRAQQEARRGPSPTALARSSLRKLELSAELQQLLQEFEEFGRSQKWNGTEGDAGQQGKQPRGAPTEGSWLCGCASGSQQEQGELTELKGDTDWEALLNSHAEDETLMATAFLEADWQEETREKLCSCAALEQGTENTQASLPGGDGMDWDFLSHFS